MLHLTMSKSMSMIGQCCICIKGLVTFEDPHVDTYIKSCFANKYYHCVQQPMVYPYRKRSLRLNSTDITPMCGLL